MTKVDDLHGPILNAAVAMALGLKTTIKADGIPVFMTYQVTSFDCGSSENRGRGDEFEPSLRWDHGGPIIELERISLQFYGTHWGATPLDNIGGELPERDKRKHLQMADGWCPVMATGASPLEAAMRAFVRLRMGDDVDV